MTWSVITISKVKKKMLSKIGSCMTVILLCIIVSFPKKMLKKVNRQVVLSVFVSFNIFRNIIPIRNILIFLKSLIIAF